MNFEINEFPIIIAGPTCSGKSDFALKLAMEYDCEIINADSIQLYKDLKVLSARPSEYFNIKHHLYGILEKNESWNANIWSKNALNLLEDKKKIIVGGTGFYINALTLGLSSIPEISSQTRNLVRNLSLEEVREKLKDLDPKSMTTIHENHFSRLSRALEVVIETKKPISFWHNKREKLLNSYSFFLVDHSNLMEKIDKRVIHMVEQGAIDEVKKLDSQFGYIQNAIGVKELDKVINNMLDMPAAIELIQTKTKQYARRQRTWFKNQLKHVNNLQKIIF